MDWRHDAVCRDEDPELFFPVGNSGPAVLQIAEAKAVCRRCPVASQCLAWALESGQDAGVWGGMSEDERRALKRRRARSPRQVPSPRRESAGRLDNRLVAAVRAGIGHRRTNEELAGELGVSVHRIRTARTLVFSQDSGEPGMGEVQPC